MFKRLTSGSSRAAASTAVAAETQPSSDTPSSPTAQPATSAGATQPQPVTTSTVSTSSSSSSSASSSSPQTNGQQGVKKFFSMFTPRRTPSNSTTLPTTLTSPTAATSSTARSSSPAVPDPSASNSTSLSNNVWAEASAALLHDWTEAGLIPADRWQLDAREAPGRQRKRLRVHSDFYDEYRLHLLPMSVAMLRLQWNRDAMLSLPLLEMKAGEAPVRTVNRLIPQLMREAAEAQLRHEQQQRDDEQIEGGAGSQPSSRKEPSATPTAVLTEPSSPTPTAVMDADGNGRPSPLSNSAAMRREVSASQPSNERDTRKHDGEDEEGDGEDADGEKQNDAFNLTNLALPRISIHAIKQAKLTKPKATHPQQQQPQQQGEDEEDKTAEEEEEDDDDEEEEDEEADDECGCGGRDGRSAECGQLDRRGGQREWQRRRRGSIAACDRQQHRRPL